MTILIEAILVFYRLSLVFTLHWKKTCTSTKGPFHHLIMINRFSIGWLMVLNLFSFLTKCCLVLEIWIEAVKSSWSEYLRRISEKMTFDKERTRRHPVTGRMVYYWGTTNPCGLCVENLLYKLQNSKGLYQRVIVFIGHQYVFQRGHSDFYIVALRRDFFFNKTIICLISCYPF